MKKLGFLMLVLLFLAFSACQQGGGTQAETSAQSTETSAADFDVVFLDTLVVHSSSTLAMTKKVVEGDASPELKSFAKSQSEKIEAEILSLENLRASAYPDALFAGNMEEAESDLAEDASKSLGTLFIEAMSKHLETAIALTKEASEKAANAEVKALAASSLSNYESELAQLKTLK